MSRAAVLLSGGVDSTALALWMRPAVAFTIDYGQASAEGETRAATQIARELGINHEVLHVNCAELGTGDLANKPPHPSAPAQEWWPYRNQFLITVAAMRAVTIGAPRLLIGSVKSDAFHVDGTPEFYEALGRVIRMQEGALIVEAPAINLSSVELVHRAGATPSLLGWTHSCHRGNYACGYCRGCTKRLLVLSELGYASHSVLRA